MVGKYKVITLCGSTRFKEAFLEAQKRLTLEGNIVISVGLFGHTGDDEAWEGMPEDTLIKTKIMLGDMHKWKIDMVDEVFVINVGGSAKPTRLCPRQAHFPECLCTNEGGVGGKADGHD